MKKLNSLLTGIILLIEILGCIPPKENIDNQLTQDEKEQGWELLFDGKTFTNWRGLGRDSVQSDHWKVENGMIRKVNNDEVARQTGGKPVEGGDLITIDSFQNFELQFEWKIRENGNSGIKYNVSESISGAHGSKYSALGFEYQILDDSADMYKNLNPSQFTGALYDIYPPENVHMNPVGQFNHSRILLRGNHGEHWLNGIKVVDYNFGTAEFDSLFQKSKYAVYPDFEKRRKGHIVITNHSDDSWYKNIKIRRLPD
ncbi:MAG: DUF1080 domain-containing protein [Mangrovibacterium sp.]